jgi:hypothetical protein
VNRTQLGVVAALSLLATGIVLADGTGAESSAAVREAVLQALQAEATVAAAPAAASGPEHAAVPAVAPAPTPAPAVADTEPPPAAPAAEAPAEEQPAKQQPVKADEPEPSKIRHVFLITLAGGAVEQTFAEQGSPAPFLAGELRPQGTLLDNFAPLDYAQLPNHFALISGLDANDATRAECPTYDDVDGDAGCVQPNTVLTLGDQVTAAGQSWRAYVQSMARADDPNTATCRRPDLPSADPTLMPRPDDEYATRRNPWIYFHSLLDLGDCLANDVDLAVLEQDLKAERTTPNLSYIAPDLCSSGTEVPCADGRAGGLAEADAFLEEWVPRIQASKAYKKDGLIVIAFTAPGPRPGDAAADAPPPRTGVLLLSEFAKPGGTVFTAQDPFSLLHSIEDLFALDALGKAKKAPSFAEAALPKAFL